MKKMLIGVITLLLVLSLYFGAFAEGLVTEGEDITSKAVELIVPEAEQALPSGDDFEATHEYADFVGEAAVSASSGVAIDEINFPDDAFRAHVEESYDDDGDGLLSEEERMKIDFFEHSARGSANLKGIEWFPNLEVLLCDNNKLTVLDVSKNTKLIILYCENNRLTSLDVNNNTKLERLFCNENQIASLDISNCKYLVESSSREPEKTDDGSIGFDSNKLRIDPATTLTANGKVIFEGKHTTQSLEKAKLTVNAHTYTGKALTPTVTVKLDGKTLKKGTDYTVSYKNNKAIGTATVTVTGKGNYTGTATATFKINPKKVSGLTLQAGKKQLTASWKKSSGVTGYQIEYGLKKNFSGAKKVTVKGAKTVKKVLKRLKSGKVYYVRVRAYKKVSKATYYSAWSKAVKKKVN